MGLLSGADRYRFEDKWATSTLEDSPATHDEWVRLKHLSRLHVSQNKALVAWRCEPELEILDVFTVVDVDLSFTTGLRVTLQDRSGRCLLASDRPQRLFDVGAFVWVPSFNDIRWTPWNWSKPETQRILRLALEVRTEHGFAGGPEEWAQHGSTLVCDATHFKRLWPAASI